jgi:hypothetical protein
MKNIEFDNGVLAASLYIPPKVCEKIIQTYRTSPKETEEVRTDLGDNKQCPNVETELPPVLFSYLRELVQEYCKKYQLTENPLFFSKLCMILGYDPGDDCPEHYDSPCLEDYHRYLVVGIILNEEYKGGEFYMPNHSVLGDGTGSVIIFPANHMYRHAVLPVSEGRRYSLITSVLCDKDFSGTEKELGEKI